MITIFHRIDTSKFRLIPENIGLKNQKFVLINRAADYPNDAVLMSNDDYNQLYGSIYKTESARPFYLSSLTVNFGKMERKNKNKRGGRLF